MLIFKHLWYSSFSPQRFKPDASSRGIPEILGRRGWTTVIFSSYILGDKKRHKDRTQNDQMLSPSQGCAAGKVETGPQGDLPQVVGMPGNAPKSFLDELSIICWVCLEVGLLLISYDFQRKSKAPYSKANKVPHSKGRVQGGRVQGQGGQQGDKNPKTLNGPVDEELGRVVLDIVEPHVLPHFHHPLHQEGAKSSSPYTHQAWWGN